MADNEVDTKDLEKGLRKMAEAFGGESAVKEMDLVAEELLRRSIDSPVPSDTRNLANSASTFVSKSRKEITFGFNSKYAAFQDAPNRTAPYVIRPVRKKILYIPISQKGKLHRAGNNPKLEGLKRGVDYVLAKKAVIPIKSYGSVKGPNHYFSQTFRENSDFALRALALRLERKARKKLKPDASGST